MDHQYIPNYLPLCSSNGYTCHACSYRREKENVCGCKVRKRNDSRQRMKTDSSHVFQIFASKADLQLHTQIHMREPKPYKCASCNKAFANSSYLSQHTRIHLGIKPYRCEICQRKFTQLSHLQQHIRTHTGDKPYKCRIPGRPFGLINNLEEISASGRAHG